MTITKNKNKVLLGIGIILAVLAIGGTLGFYYMAPSRYLALDVNPSIEIHTNRLNQVTSIDPVNEDAKKIMAGYQLTDRNLETVIKNIVDRMILNGFIASDKDNQILITTGEDQNASELSKTANTIVETYLTEKQVDANLIPQSIKITAQSIKEAHKNHVSAGKMALIQKLIENDSTLTVDQLSKERISDLFALAISKNISLDGIMYHHTTQNTSANTAIPSGAINDVQAGNLVSNNAIIEDDEDSDKEDQNDDQSTDIKKVSSSKHDDAKYEKQEKEDKKDRNSYRKYNENKAQSDSQIEDQDDNDDQEDIDVEDQDEEQNDSDKKAHHDYQKIESNEDQYNNDNENDNEEYEYKQSDNENNDQEDIQQYNDQKDHSDSQNSDHESEGFDD